MKEGINRKGSGRSFYLRSERGCSDQWDFSPYPPKGETNFVKLVIISTIRAEVFRVCTPKFPYRGLSN